MMGDRAHKVMNGRPTDETAPGTERLSQLDSVYFTFVQSTASIPRYMATEQIR